MLKLKLHWQILIAIAGAIIVGLLITPETTLLGVSVIGSLDFVGTLFLNALKMLIVPLVLSSIICGIANMGESSEISRLGGKTLGFYMLSSLLAILMGLLLVNLFTPGIIDGEPARAQLSLSSDAAVNAQLAKVEGKSGSDVMAVFLRMVPPNIVDAAAKGQMLGLIFFALLFGYFLSRVTGDAQTTMMNFWQGLQQIMIMLTNFVMKFAPLGVFALVGETMAKTGLALFVPLLVFMATVTLALLLHAGFTMAVLLKYVAKVKPLKHYQAMSPALLTAFSTASSSATLPLTMDCVENQAGVSKKTSSFVLPLGATINMDGTALYECVAAMFIAQAYGLDLSFATQFTIVAVALLTSIGVAGIPAASLVAIAVILTAIGLPLEGIGLLLVTDRILDMMRTAVNVFSDSCCAVVIARSENEATQLV
ncbi:MAG: dicarboxylate/amino acid:cation symporter [Pseudomonadales bacterium]|nr:dicarboxylate/amino acid:cation symporter [Pseudomonadales bacterium]